MKKNSRIHTCKTSTEVGHYFSLTLVFPYPFLQARVQISNSSTLFGKSVMRARTDVTILE